MGQLIFVDMNSINAGYPSNSVLPAGGNRVAPAPGKMAVGQASETATQSAPGADRIARINTSSGQAHAVFSYGHTAHLQQGARLGTLLDVHA